MKRFILLFITCIVMDQLKATSGWITTCKGIDENGEVVFAEKIIPGKAATYRPFIVPGDDLIHGEVYEVGDAPKEAPRVEVMSDHGKASQ